MAEIKPIKGWRYNSDFLDKISELTSPLFDVISQKQRDILYENPNNSIYLSVPIGSNPHKNAKNTFENWQKNKVLIKDKTESIYVYYQYFYIPGYQEQFCRKGFICNIRAYDWKENIILRHENTIQKAVEDQTKLLEITKLNASATMGLYTDESNELDYYMDECIKTPVYDVEDYQGVRDVMGIISNPEIINKFIKKLENKKVILADGHHRYQSSIEYRKNRQKEDNYSYLANYNYHMMYLTNTNSSSLRILPTHRLIKNIDNFSKKNTIEKLSKYFEIKEVDNYFSINEIIVGKKWYFGLVFNDSAYALKLKEAVFSSFNWDFPLEVKKLDLSIMHYFIIDRVLGIPGKEHRTTDKISFERNFSNCISEVKNENFQLAIITNEISIEEVKKVCESNSVMPQKSTYFYPKLICGFVYSDISE